MTFIPTPNGAKLIEPFVAGAKTWSNTLWFTKVGFDDDDMISLANVVQSCFYAAFDSKFSDTLQYGPPTVYDMRSEDGHVVTGTDDPEGGEGAAEMLTPATSCCLTLRTADRGRSARGRLYLAGFCEDGIGDGGVFAGAITTAVEGFATCLLETVVTIGWQWVVRSIQQGGVHLTTANTRLITSAEVRSAQATSQRRRNQRG